MRGVQPTDEQLLRSADDGSFECFYRRNVDLVTQYVAYRVERPDLIMDVVSETFAKALEHRRRYEPRKGPAIAWLLTIARNVLLDMRRRGRVANTTQRRLRMEPLELDDRDLLEIQSRAGQPLTDALEKLPPDQRNAIRQRIIEEAPYTVIAKATGATEQVVRQRVRRGLLNLRRGMKGEHG